MALPKLDVPIYTMTLLSDDRNIRYRPFLVKEEKILYMAMEGNDNDEMTLAMNSESGLLGYHLGCQNGLSLARGACFWTALGYQNNPSPSEARKVLKK